MPDNRNLADEKADEAQQAFIANHQEMLDAWASATGDREEDA